jgi:hypothetical protein
MDARRYSITSLPEVEARWNALLVELIAQQTDPTMINMMRSAYWYAVYTIAPSYADEDDAATRFALRTHPRRNEGSDEQAHR